MSQLCRAFAQDLSQMLDTGKPSNTAEHGPRNGFSPFACLSALKQAKQNSTQYFGSDCNTASKKTSISPANPSNAVIQSSKSDSGFQSAVLDSSHIPASSALYPSSEKGVQSHQFADFEMETHRTAPFKFARMEKDNDQLGDSFKGTETKETFPNTDQEKELLSLEKQSDQEKELLNLGVKSTISAESISIQLNSDGEGHPSTVKRFPPSDQMCDSMLQKTPHSFPSVKASEFRTASNKNIKVSLANLKKARCLFEENEGQLTKCMDETKAKMSTIVGSGKNKSSNRPTCSAKKPQDYLTASQKADVTELCSLLEEADTQFEFTQFKATKLNQHKSNGTPPQEADKELDPDFLSGIDFDDSFELDGEKRFEKGVPPHKIAFISHHECNNDALITLNKARDPSESNAVKGDNSSTEDVHLSSKHSPECSSRTALKRPVNLDTAGFTATNKPENINPPVFGLGFKTAGGNDLKVSKMGLSKAMALFSDLENSTTVPETGDSDDVTKFEQDQKSLDQKSLENVTRNELQQSVDKNTRNILCSKEDECNFNKSTLERDPVCLSILTEKHSPGCTNDELGMDFFGINKMVSNTCQMGFQTASGKGISISAKAMQEANTFFKDSDLKHHGADMSVIQRVDDEKNTNVQPMKVNNSEEPLQGTTVCEHVDIGSGTAHEKMQQQDDAEVPSDTCKQTMAMTNTSFDINQSLTPKPLSSSLCTLNIGSSVPAGKSSCGFNTASGKKVYVSANAMTKAKSLLNECNMIEVGDSQLKQEDDTSRIIHPISLIQASAQQNAGFQTASGKGVSISSAALQKAKSFFNEWDVEDQEKEEIPHSNVLYPIPRKSGFFTATGTPVICSAEAIQKAKAVFSDISAIPDVSDTKSNAECKRGQKGASKIHCSFTTAGGTKVEVSQKSLLKAKHLLKEPADGERADSACIPSLCSTISFGTNKSGLSKMDILKSTSDCRVNGRCDPELENISKDSLQNKDTTVTTSGIKCAMFDSETDQCFTDAHNLPSMEESSSLNFQSRNLSDCLDTQQETLDCTKAFLQDDVQIGNGLSMTLENVPMQEKTKTSKSSDQTLKRTEKRSVEDADVSNQPPRKRRLMEDFDRAADCPVGPTVLPEGMHPEGMMKDRSVFQYSNSLQLSTTTPPPTDVKNSIGCQWQMRSRSLNSKMTVFVPPFPKHMKRDADKSTVAQGGTTTTFVPPFKKVKTILHERFSSNPEQSAKAKRFVPLTPKTLSRTEVSGTMSTEDGSTSSLVETGSDKHLNSQNLPVDCGVNALTTETPEVEDKPEGQDLLQNLELARDMQEMRIRKKKRQTIRPVPGSVFQTKTSGASRISLKFAVNGQNPTKCTPKELHCYGVHQHVIEITSETSESYRFSLHRSFGLEAFIAEGGVQLADGGWLIPSNDGTAGKEEFYRALCDTPGVDPKLVSEEWVNNHYRWIVWKRASMERSFPEIMGSICLTPEQVLLQLKYRYDVEVDHSHRSALRKITERDDTAAKTLVLCVCGVVSWGHSPETGNEDNIKTAQTPSSKTKNPIAVVWMTDGWYSIKVQLDGPLTTLLQAGRLTVGDKMITYGAQLVGSQDACSPLEAPDTLMLKICANSSRPVRWDTKLGFYRDPRPFLLPLSSLYSNGGPVGCVDVIILRCYPIQWMEKKADGGIVFRSARAEEREERRYNSDKQKAMETLFAKIQAEFENEEKGNNKPQIGRRTLGHQDMASLQDGEELHEAVGDDPAYLESNLSEKQLQTLCSYRRSLVEKKQGAIQERYRRAVENEEGCPKRDVSPVWRLCVADSMEQLGKFYQLNFWRPSLDLQSLLREGCRYKVYNLTTSDGKRRCGNTRVQLTATKKTQVQEKQVSQEWLLTRFQPRTSVSFPELQNPEFQPLCGEVDLVGYIITIIDEHGCSPAFFLADAQQNFVKVRCFSGFVQSGLEDVVKPRVLLALSNLQLRTHCSSTIPVAFAGDLTIFSTNPKEIHLQETLGRLRLMIQGQDKYFLAAEEKLFHLIQADGLSFTSPALQPTTPGHKVDRRQDTPAPITSCPAARSLGSFTPVTRSLSPLNCSAEKDPRSLKRKRALDYLCRIPSPPPLTHLGSVASPSINKTFHPPRRSGTPGTLKTAQSPACKPHTSPAEAEWVGDEELAMIDTQAFHVGELL